MARFDMWTWENRGGYRIPPESDDAAAYMKHYAFRDASDSSKGKMQEALGRYSKWLQRKFNRDVWEFEWSFQSGGGNNGPRDSLTWEERHKIRQAALGIDGNPNYGLRNDESGSDDGDRTTSWKYTSIVWTSLDAGFRPVEVGDACVSWVDTENGILRIPREESSKNEG